MADSICVDIFVYPNFCTQMAGKTHRKMPDAQNSIQYCPDFLYHLSKEDRLLFDIKMIINTSSGQ